MLKCIRFFCCCVFYEHGQKYVKKKLELWEIYIYIYICVRFLLYIVAFVSWRKKGTELMRRRCVVL